MRVLLVHVNFSAENMQEDLDEFQDLAVSAGLEIVEVMTASKKVPEPKYFVGSGKAEEIHAAVLGHKAELVLFNHVLSPTQERNLEKLLKCKVLDRTGLILDIFAQRARSFEGKLQVELAMLKHLATRLVGGWTHLERQRGGIGLRGGPGETQLEVDRRQIRTRIKFITQRLLRVREQRNQSRRARKRAIIPTIALVGYTNAGKSTLFNRLSHDSVYVANQLFATLDPTLRRIKLPEMGPVIIADTVGFIRHLPHDLVEAFHATLEEVTEADLLLHVIDFQDERRHANIDQVNAVLSSIGAEDVPRLLVYNKIDLAEGLTPGIERDQDGKILRIRISAHEGWGIEELESAIAELLTKDITESSVILAPKDAKLRAKFYELEAVVSEKIDEKGYHHLIVRMSQSELKRLLA